MQRVVKWSGQVKWANMTIRKPLKLANQCSPHLYEVLPRSDKHGVDLISDVLPFGRLWYGEPNAISNAIGYAKFSSRSHHAVTSVYDEAGKLVETHEHAGDFQEL